MHLEFVLFFFVFAKTSGLTPVQEIKGDVYIAVLLKNCPNVTESPPVPFELQALASSALWTTQRINFLELLWPIKFGISIHEVCNGTAHFKTIFELFQKEEYLLGLITDERLNEKLLQFCDILDIRSTSLNRYNSFLVKASLQFLSAMGWTENITIFVPDEHVAGEFFSYSKNIVCVKECVLYGSRCPAILNNTSPFVFFGYKHHFDLLKKWQNLTSNSEDISGLFVPLDGSLPTDLPANSFVIVPPQDPPTRDYKFPENILPTPSFFEITNPILTYVKNVETFLINNCNETASKLNCFKEKYKKMYRPVLMTPGSILSMLKIESLQQDFIYNIYQIDNETQNSSELVKKNNLFQPLSKVFEYSVFGNNLTLIDQQIELVYPSANSSEMDSIKECVTYFSRANIKYYLDDSEIITFKSESWVFAFLSLSLLGAVFCIAILIFILISIFRRDVLEGNPFLTLALLLAVMLLFCSVLPFSLEYNKFTRYPLCLLKSLGITLGYALVFSLLLSRCILLATASKEIGFMSHIAGPVQSFLCLFIFGVQAALSLQLLSKCYEIFRGTSFVYLMSYNTMLLLLLLCLCPLIFKCQRNYREGKYFAIAIILTNCVWFIWVPLYAVLAEEWHEPLLCFGLVSTASIFLGAIFIPRTYLMTIAAARNKITSALPSLATATSAIDIYRGQPIYDCVNVAAINAVTVARAGVTAPSQNLQQPDLYSCPALPEDEEFDFRCDTPTDDDKVTRF